MATQQDLQLYANLMDEVKARVDAIRTALSGQTQLAVPVVRELSYLQLRMLCELIALACLVAHGDLKSLKAHRTGKSYSADDMLDRLEILRPHFYPIAVRPARGTEGVDHNLTPVDPSPLPKDHLLKLYGLCHKHVHRGSLKQVLKSDHIDMTIDLPEIAGWAQRINDLLAVHTIAIDAKNIIICILRNRDDNNNVQVVTARARVAA